MRADRCRPALALWLVSTDTAVCGACVAHTHTHMDSGRYVYQSLCLCYSCNFAVVSVAYTCKAIPLQARTGP
jgi:hypothetical protein